MERLCDLKKCLQILKHIKIKELPQYEQVLVKKLMERYTQELNFLLKGLH